MLNSQQGGQMSHKKVIFGVNVENKVKDKRDPIEWAQRTEEMIQRYLGLVKQKKVYKMVKTEYEKPSEVRRKEKKLRRKQLDRLMRIRGDWKPSQHRRKKQNKFQNNVDGNALSEAFEKLASEKNQK